MLTRARLRPSNFYRYAIAALAFDGSHAGVEERAECAHLKKDTRLLNSMLRRGRASGGLVGSSNALCAARWAIPSPAESWFLRRITSSGDISGNQCQ